jgi:hypothetical protein
MARQILSLAVATVVASVALPGAQETIVGRNEQSGHSGGSICIIWFAGGALRLRKSYGGQAPPPARAPRS